MEEPNTTLSNFRAAAQNLRDAWDWDLRPAGKKTSIFTKLQGGEVALLFKLLERVCNGKQVLPEGKDPAVFCRSIHLILGKVADGEKLIPHMHPFVDLHLQEEDAYRREDWIVVRNVREMLCLKAAEITDTDFLAKHFSWLLQRALISDRDKFRKHLPQEMIRRLPAAAHLAAALTPLPASPKAKKKTAPPPQPKTRAPKPQKAPPKSWLEQLQEKADSKDIDGCYKMLMEDRHSKEALRGPLHLVLRALIDKNEWDKVWKLRTLKVWNRAEETLLDSVATDTAAHAKVLFARIAEERPKGWGKRLVAVWALCQQKLKAETKTLRQELLDKAPKNGDMRQPYLTALGVEPKPKKVKQQTKTTEPKQKPSFDELLKEYSGTQGKPTQQPKVGIYELLTNSHNGVVELRAAIRSSMTNLKSWPKGYAADRTVRAGVYQQMKRCVELFPNEPEMCAQTLKAVGNALIITSWSKLDAKAKDALFELAYAMMGALVRLPKQQFDTCGVALDRIATRIKDITTVSDVRADQLTTAVRCCQSRANPDNVTAISHASTCLIVTRGLCQMPEELIQGCYLALYEAFETVHKGVRKCSAVDLAMAAKDLLDFDETTTEREHKRWALAVVAYCRAATDTWVDRARTLYLSCAQEVTTALRREPVLALLPALAGAASGIQHEVHFLDLLQQAIEQKLVTADRGDELLEKLLARNEATSLRAAAGAMGHLQQAGLLRESSQAVAKFETAIKRVSANNRVLILQGLMVGEVSDHLRTLYLEAVVECNDHHAHFNALDTLLRLPQGKEATLKLFGMFDASSAPAALLAGRLDFLGEKVPAATQFAELRRAQRDADRMWKGELAPQDWKSPAHDSVYEMVLTHRLELRLFRDALHKRSETLRTLEGQLAKLFSRFGRDELACEPAQLRLAHRELCQALLTDQDRAERIGYTLVDAHEGGLYNGSNYHLVEMLETLLKDAPADLVGPLWREIHIRGRLEDTFLRDLFQRLMVAAPKEEVCARGGAIAVATTTLASQRPHSPMAEKLCEQAKTSLDQLAQQKLVATIELGELVVDAIEPIARYPHLTRLLYPCATKLFNLMAKSCAKEMQKAIKRLQNMVGVQQKPEHCVQMTHKGFCHVAQTDKPTQQHRLQLIASISSDETAQAEYLLRSYPALLNAVPSADTRADRYRQMSRLLQLFAKEPAWQAWLVQHFSRHLDLPKKGEQRSPEETELLATLRQHILMSCLNFEAEDFNRCYSDAVTPLMKEWPFELTQTDQLIRLVMFVKTPLVTPKVVESAAAQLANAVVQRKIDREWIMPCARAILSHLEETYVHNAAASLLSVAKLDDCTGYDETLPARFWRLHVTCLTAVDLNDACRVYTCLPATPLDMSEASQTLLGALSRCDDPYFCGEKLRMVFHAALAAGHLTGAAIHEYILKPLAAQKCAEARRSIAYVLNSSRDVAKSNGECHAPLLKTIDSEQNLLDALQLLHLSPKAVELHLRLLEQLKDKPQWQAAVVGSLGVLRSEGKTVDASCLNCLSGDLLRAAQVVFRLEGASCPVNDPYLMVMQLQGVSLHWKESKSVSPATKRHQWELCTDALDLVQQCDADWPILSALQEKTCHRALVLLLSQPNVKPADIPLPSFKNIAGAELQDLATVLTLLWPLEGMARLLTHLRAEDRLCAKSLIFRVAVSKPNAPRLQAILVGLTSERTPEGCQLAVTAWSHITNKRLCISEMADLFLATVKPIAGNPARMAPYYDVAVAVCSILQDANLDPRPLVDGLRNLVGFETPTGGELQLTSEGFVAIYKGKE